MKGIPLTKYCDERQLTLRERLDQFVPVCQAVQHAHQKGIIHRDLKPSNVLVALYDGEPVCKVIDFGVAKATSQTLTDKTMFTAVGQIVGTLEYMSPEQAQVNQLDIDTRSDIYSLGVLLYELLTGSTPFDRQRLRSAAFDELMRIIREEEPPRPSFRLSTIETLPSVAACRRTESQRLPSLVRGELDWIVMKALEKDRSRRYETANGFAADIQRFLDDEPVLACPPSAGYRLQKLARRNKVALVTAALVATSLVLGLISTSWQWKRAVEKTKLAIDQQELAEQERNRAALAEEDAKRQRDTANRERVKAVFETRRATVARLAAQSQAMRDELAVESLMVATEAVESARRHKVTGLLKLAHGTLLTATHNVGGRPLMGHEDRVMDTLFTPNGRWLVTASSDNTARVWDLTSDNPLATCRILEGANTRRGGGIAISPNGRCLATVGSESAPTILLWDLGGEHPEDGPIVLAGHEEYITSVAISPDGRWVASASRDKTARVWDLTANDPSDAPRVLQHDVGIGPLAFGPDNRWLATGRRDGTVSLWDLTAEDMAASSQKLVGGHPRGGVVALAISSDGRWLATGAGSQDDDARLWNLREFGREPIVLKGHTRGITTVKFCPRGRWLVTGSYDDTARLWDLESDLAQPSSQVLRGHEDWIWTMNISDDGRWLVTGSHDATARLWDLMSDDPADSPIVLRAHEDTVAAVAVGPKSRWLVTGSWDNTVRLWDLTDENPATKLVKRLPFDGRSSLVTSPDGRFLIAASRGEARIWEFNRTTDDPVLPSRTLVSGGRTWPPLAVIPSYLATGGEGKARLWDLNNLDRSPRDLDTNKGIVGSISLSSNERWLVTGDDSGSAQLWDLTNPTASPRPLAGNRREGISVRQRFAVSPDGNWLATTNLSEVRLWNLTAGDPLSKSFALRKSEITNINRLRFSPDSRWLVAQHGRGAVELWDRQARKWSPLQGRAEAVAFTPNSRWLAGVSWDGSSRLWDLRSDGSESRTVILDKDRAALYSVAVSPDGRWLATGGEDTVVRVWDLAATDPGAPSLALRGHRQAVAAIAFSPDSRWVITGSTDDTVRFWDLELDSSIRRAHKLAGRAVRSDSQVSDQSLP